MVVSGLVIKPRFQLLVGNILACCAPCARYREAGKVDGQEEGGQVFCNRAHTFEFLCEHVRERRGGRLLTPLRAGREQDRIGGPGCESIEQREGTRKRLSIWSGSIW
eukprot:2724744-Rhodomonas_salina.1